MLTEDRNSKTRKIDMADSLKIAKLINNEDKKVAYRIAKNLKPIAKGIDMIADAFNDKGRLLYFGAGTSGRLGVLDASECVPTFGVAETMVQAFIAGGEYAIRNAVEGAEDSVALAKKDAETADIKANDVVIAISASGNARYLLEIIKIAREKKARTIALTANPEAKIRLITDLAICVPTGPEVIAGSTRMKAGTAQKMILNMLSTGAMIKIGKTYENLMIDVMAVNEKLRKRAIGIVAEIACAPETDAEQILLRNKYKVKHAILHLKYGLSEKQATAELAKHNGKLRPIFLERD